MINPASAAGSSLSALHTFHANGRSLNSVLEKLATGRRINRGADDPAGLITSENLRAVLEALEAESQNLGRADQVAAVADAGLSEISGLVSEAEALVIANANSAGLSDAEIEANQIELNSIVSTVNRIVSSTSFNGDQLLDGSATISVAGGELTIDQISLSDPGGGEAALDSLRSFRNEVNALRGELGAFSKYTINSRQNSVRTAIENISEAESIIRDTDYGKETSNLARVQVLIAGSLKALGVSASQSGALLSLFA